MRETVLRHLTTRAALLATAVACLGVCAPASAAPPFAADSPWNAPLARQAQLDSDSQGLVGELGRLVATYGPWINSNEFSVPIYTVPADQPGVPVRIDDNNDMWTNAADAIRLAQTLDDVPIPPGARPAAGTDKHMVIWQPATDTMWELWLARNPPAAGDVVSWRDNSPGWHAAWGAKIENVTNASGVNPAPYGATASGLALAGGLITFEDLESGHIDHALALAIPGVMRGRFVPPANRTDGAYDGAHAIAEGQRFRLPASLDIASLDLPPVTRMMAEAAQRYGIIVRDYAGSVAFYAQDPVPAANYVLRRMLGSQSPAQALSRFPWSSLQAVDPVQPSGSEPESDPAADPVDPIGPATDPAPLPDEAPSNTAPLPSSPAPAQPPADPQGPAAATGPTHASAGHRQRIAHVLRHGVRVLCRQRAGGVCAAHITVRGVVVLRGSRRLTSHGRAVVHARATGAGRRLLHRTHRRVATLTVTVPGAKRVTRRLVLVR